MNLTRAVERAPLHLTSARVRALAGFLIPLGQALFIAFCLYVFLRGWQRDFSVPLDFSVDALMALAQSKSTYDNGWWWFNPMLGGPSGFNALAFPANSNVDQAVVWVVSRFVRDAVLAINASWLLMVVLSGLSATWCLRRLGASPVSALVAGTLFALSPFALYRHLAHFWMVIYLVPFACAIALLLASGRERGTWKETAVLLGGCVLLGFNYVYYAFFGCFFIAGGALLGFLTYRDWRLLRAGGVAVAVIAACTLLNLAPSLQTWKREGKPVVLQDKGPSESEFYGLKIRQLVSPAFNHAFPPFGWWFEKEGSARFPLETENTGSRLGVIASIGFLGLLGLLFVPRWAEPLDSGRTLLAAGRLTLAAVLLATIGGFGSLFSLLITPEIRAWNRITPFIAFFSLAAVALTTDALFRTRTRRLIAAAIILVLGLGDQRMAAIGLNAKYAGIAAEMPPLHAFVGALESKLPDRALVLQLPFRAYLYDTGVARMTAYEHLKLYAVSRRIRWSYPALSNEQLRWQQAAAQLDLRQLTPTVAAAGYSAIVVDRYGYDDQGTAVVDALTREVGAGNVLAKSERYVAFDIRSLPRGEGAAAAVRFSPMAAATLNMPACGSEPVNGIDTIGGHPPSIAGHVRVRAATALTMHGWAADRQSDAPARALDVVLDGTPYPAFYGSDRADVAQHFNRPSFLRSGFSAEIPAAAITGGRHSLTVRVVPASGQCYYESAPTLVIVE